MKTAQDHLKENLIFAMRQTVPDQPDEYYTERIEGWFSGKGDFGDEHTALIATFQVKAIEEYASLKVNKAIQEAIEVVQKSVIDYTDRTATIYHLNTLKIKDLTP